MWCYFTFPGPAYTAYKGQGLSSELDGQPAVKSVRGQPRTGDTIMYRAMGPYRALSCCVIGRWATMAGVRLWLQSADYIRLNRLFQFQTWLLTR